MKVIFAADGSEYTKKALAFLVTHENLAGAEDELLVLNVQPRVLLGMRPIVSPDLVNDFYRDEANKVLDPIKKFLDRHLMCSVKTPPTLNPIHPRSQR